MTPSPPVTLKQTGWKSRHRKELPPFQIHHVYFWNFHFLNCISCSCVSLLYYNWVYLNISSMNSHYLLHHVTGFLFQVILKGGCRFSQVLQTGHCCSFYLNTLTYLRAKMLVGQFSDLKRKQHGVDIFMPSDCLSIGLKLHIGSWSIWSKTKTFIFVSATHTTLIWAKATLGLAEVLARTDLTPQINNLQRLFCFVSAWMFFFSSFF